MMFYETYRCSLPAGPFHSNMFYNSKNIKWKVHVGAHDFQAELSLWGSLFGCLTGLADMTEKRLFSYYCSKVRKGKIHIAQERKTNWNGNGCQLRVNLISFLSYFIIFHSHVWCWCQKREKRSKRYNNSSIKCYLNVYKLRIYFMYFLTTKIAFLYTLLLLVE